MINVLSYVGMNLQSEVCLWTLLGLFCTIFDATLFKVNANLKQVWQMSMPVEISMPVQRVLRTMISGVMLVQCFTVYVYIAAYIVLLYPAFLMSMPVEIPTPVQRVLRTMISGVMLVQCFTVYVYFAVYIVLLYPAFLEERPVLVLPWLLLAAIRKLLCELLSLALGLGTCLLVGAARPPCIKFVVIKIASIMPSVYMWMLILSYYNTLKVTSVFQKFPTAVPANDLDYGLELAIRRRRTKSLLGEAQLRRRLLSNWYSERPQSLSTPTFNRPASKSCNADEPHTSTSETNKSLVDNAERKPDAINTSEDYKYTTILGTCEDMFCNEITVPRNNDRITEQIVLMLLRIGTYLGKAKHDDFEIFKSRQTLVTPSMHFNLETCSAQAEDNPPLVGSSKESTASYLRLYPQIFMKSASGQNFEYIRKAQSSILYTFNEATRTEREPVESKSMDTGRTILVKEKATNSRRMKSVEKLNRGQKTNNGLKNATQQLQLKDEPERNVSQNEIKINSHENLVPEENMSVVGSDDSLRLLVAKMQVHLSEIIALRDIILNNQEARSINNSSGGGSRENLENE